MFRIRRIFDDVLPANREALRQARDILASQFPGLPQRELDGLAEHLRHPFRKGFRSVLYVAENARGRVMGFAMLLHEPRLRFCYLDYLASSCQLSGRGVGGALYERVRSEALALGVGGLFFECLPDDPAQCRSPEAARVNAARLRFYERYGARPIIHTAYQAPMRPGQIEMPFLVFDGLDRGRPLRREYAQAVARTILEREYGPRCTPQYVRMVVESFREDPVALREFRYTKPAQRNGGPVGPPPGEPIALVVNDRHEIHHVRDRGYVESPVRVGLILREIEVDGRFVRVQARAFPDRHILAVHDADFVRYLRQACANVPASRSVYPYVFPIRNATRPPKEMSARAGYFCIDTFTPLNANAFLAARRAVDCALTAAEQVLHGSRLAYALVRPPGHHAERRSFGGFCYFNNTAIAAQYLSALGRVAIVDVDYHHGNGQQTIFYDRADVLTISIHGAPDFAYPYFSGFADERGEGAGEGFNHNFPLAEHLEGPQYRKALARALQIVARFAPDFLVVALGLDPAKGDPTGTWSLRAKDFEANGRMLGGLRLPTLVVQEGGYRTRTLGVNAKSFFQGLAAGAGV